MLNFLKNGKGEILNLMFLNPDKKYYLTELAKILGKEPTAYQKHVEGFIKEGIFHEERIGNMRFFWLNKEYSLYDEIRSIVSKTIGLEAKLKSTFEEVGSIEIAFIFGSFATDRFNQNSDIDLFIVGSEDDNMIIKKITELEDEISRKINYHVYSKQEILKKKDIQDSFIYNILHREIILLKGDINELR